jgi:type IV secretory pathway VirB4 component
MNNITYLAKTNFRNQNQLFGIKQNDRLLHTFVLGKTGTGKTTLLKNMFLQDIANHQGCAFLDPHGDVVREIVDKTKRGANEGNTSNIIYLDCTDPNQKIGFNPLKHVPLHKRPLVASGLLEIFEKLFGKKSWGAKMEHILRNALLTLLDQDQADLRDINRLLINKAYQEACLGNITNDEVRKF